LHKAVIDKGMQRNCISFSNYILLDVCVVLKSSLYEGSFHCREKKKLVGARSDELDGFYQKALHSYDILYILESNPHPNLIRISFCRFLKQKKVSSRF